MKNKKDSCFCSVLHWQGLALAMALALLAFGVQCLVTYWSQTNGALDFDQTIFYLIGRAWCNGLLPYVDAWDSKGPLIFLFNGLGQLFNTLPKGVLYIQCLNFACVLWMAWICLRRKCDKGQTAVCLFLFVAAYIIVCSGGNQVGDYTLAISVATVSCTYWWSLGLERGQVEHPARYAFLYGIFLAACLLSRLTNAMVLVSSVAVIGLVLIWHRRWNNLARNAFSFVAGFVCLMAPAALYFVWHGAWGEMWYAMFSYNVEYAFHSSPVDIGSKCAWVYVMFYFISLFSVPLYAMAVWNDARRRKVAIVWCAITMPVAFWLGNSYANSNYAISYLPVLFVSLQQLMAYRQYAKNDGKGIKGKRLEWRMVTNHCALSLIALVICVGSVNQLRLYKIWNSGVDECVKAQKRLAREIPRFDTMVAYNCSPGVYVEIDKLPRCRFFVCQDWAIENGPSLRAKVREAYKRTDAQWVLVSDMEHCAIRDILEHRYVVVRTDATHRLALLRLRR